MQLLVPLLKKQANIGVILDSLQQVAMLKKIAKQDQVIIQVYIEVDCDQHRAGVSVNDPLLIAIGKAIDQSLQLYLKGVLLHAGESYNCKSIADIEVLSRHEKTTAIECKKKLEDNGIDCKHVSIGSAPTVKYAKNFNGITEVRAGVYMFYDLVMAGLGVCEISDIALSVVTTVIGHQKSKNWLITDAGWMALSRDRGTAKQVVDLGYGVVCDINGNILNELIVSSTNQEHGMVTHRNQKPINYNAFPVGTKIRILPNHACSTAAMHQSFKVINSKLEVIDSWPRISGW